MIDKPTPEKTYVVAVQNTFEATSPEDAVAQMAAWLDDNAYFAGYRVDNIDTGKSMFIDAESIDFDGLGAEGDD